MYKFIFIFVLLIISLKSHSQGAVIYDKGADACYEFITEYEQISSQYLKLQKDGQITTSNEEYIKIQELSKWVVFYYGYVSRINASVNDNVFKEMNSQAIVIELKNFCEKNPSAIFLFAVQEVANKYVNSN